MKKCDTRTASNAEVRIVSENGTDAGATKNEFRKMTQLTRSPRENDAVINDVRGKFWWCLLEYLTYSTHHFA